jgi:hypothetical protein
MMNKKRKEIKMENYTNQMIKGKNQEISIETEGQHLNK